MSCGPLWNLELWSTLRINTNPLGRACGGLKPKNPRSRFRTHRNVVPCRLSHFQPPPRLPRTVHNGMQGVGPSATSSYLTFVIDTHAHLDSRGQSLANHLSRPSPDENVATPCDSGLDPTTRIEPSHVTLISTRCSRRVQRRFSLPPSRNIPCELYENPFSLSTQSPPSPIRAPATVTRPIPPIPPNVFLSGSPKGEDPLVLLR